MARNPRRAKKRASMNDKMRIMEHRIDEAKRQLVKQQEMNQAIIKDITMFIDIMRYDMAEDFAYQNKGEEKSKQPITA